MDCNDKYRVDEWIIDIFIHIIILLAVLSIGFWTIIAKSEKDNLQGQVENQIDNLIDNYKAKGDEQKILASIDYNKLSNIYDGKPSKEVKDSNKSLLKLNIIIIGMLFFTFIMIWIILNINCGKCIPVGKIFIENIGLFIIIGIIEVLFFINIATKFVPVEPSFMVNTVINHFKQD